MEDMIFIKIKEMSNILGVTESAVKKYYLLIEENGYQFKRSQQGQILFSESDVTLFKKLIHFKNQPKTTLAKAAERVVSSITDIKVMNEFDKEIITNTEDVSVMTELKSMKEIILNQQTQIDSLVEQQNQNQKLIESDVSRRDSLLMKSIRETQEMKTMILTLEQSMKEIASSQNQSFWNWILKILNRRE